MRKRRAYITVSTIYFLIVLAAFLISVFYYPELLTSPINLITLLVGAIIGVGNFIKMILEIRKLTLETIKNETQPNRVFSISGGVKQVGDQNIIINELHIENIDKFQIGDNLNQPVYFQKKKEQIITPQIFSPPLLPEYYIERHSLLENIFNIYYLARRNDIRLPDIALTGIGGSGKTVLAQAITTNDDFIKLFPGGAFWLQLGPEIDNEESLNGLFTQVFSVLGLDSKELPSLYEKAMVLRNYLGNNKILFILDDLWNAEVIQMIKKYFRDENISILTTTRIRELPSRIGIGNVINVDSMAKKEAIKLVEKRLGDRLTDKDSHKVLEILNYHALAITLASAQISIGDVTWKDILTSLKNGQDVRALDFDDPKNKEESLAITFKSSIESLPEVEKNRLLWLGVLARGVPFDLEDAINQFIDFREKYPPRGDDELIIILTPEIIAEGEETLNILYRRGLVDIVRQKGFDKKYRIHPLLHDFLHQQLKSLDTYKFAVLVHLVSSMLTLEATTIREKQFPLFDFRYHQWNTAIHRAWLALPQNGNKFPITEESAIHYLLLMIPRLNAYWSKQGESEKIITWSTRLLQLIKDTTYQIDSLEEDSISLIIDILENYIDKQDHEFAKKYLDILEQEINASKNPEKFMSEFLFYKGNYFLGKGEPEKAIEIFKENMKCIGDGEGGSLQKGKVLGNIGSAYLQLQMYDEGIDYLQKAIDIAKDNEDAIGYAIRLGNLGAAYLAKSDHILNNAEGLLEESYGILKKSNHFLSIARKAMNLGSINYRTGKINLGKAYFDEAIRIYSLINHPELNQAKKALSLYEGKIDIPSPLPPNIITYLSVDALLGDKIAEAKVFPTINFLSSHPEINNELALFSQRLKLIFKGERNEEILSKDLPKEFEYSILSILKIIENPEMSDLANRFGNLVIGIKLGDKNAIEYGKNLIEYIESGSVTDDFHTIELARCLQHILNGEKDVDIIVGDLKDDFQKMTVLNSLAYSNYLLSDSEE